MINLSPLANETDLEAAAVRLTNRPVDIIETYVGALFQLQMTDKAYRVAGMHNVTLARNEKWSEVADFTRIAAGRVLILIEEVRSGDLILWSAP